MSEYTCRKSTPGIIDCPWSTPAKAVITILYSRYDILAALFTIKGSANLAQSPYGSMSRFARFAEPFTVNAAKMSFRLQNGEYRRRLSG